MFLNLGCIQQSISPGLQSTDKSDSTIRVGISANALPFASKQGGGIRGLEPAFASMLGEYLNKKIELIEVPWKDQIDFLNSGKTDIIMSGMTITKQRSYLVDFAKPYLRSGQIMLVRMEDGQRFSTGVSSLLNTNYRIGIVADTVSDYFVTMAINKANGIVFKTSQQAVDALVKREIDVFVYDAPIICYYAAKHQQDKLIPIVTMATEEYIGWAVKKNDSALLTQLNNFIDALEKQGKLQDEIKYWIPYLYR